jgi:hypothetical protein
MKIILCIAAGLVATVTAIVRYEQAHRDRVVDDDAAFIQEMQKYQADQQRAMKAMDPSKAGKR